MTQEERDLLIENNKMLKTIISYLQIKENDQSRDMKDFIMNVIANQFNLK